MPAVHIAVTFLTARYHGGEWPPSPLRLFQAMLAGVMTGGNREYRTVAGEAFAWLERQKAPLVVAEEAVPLQAYRISAPNNDFDIAAKAWNSGKEYDTAKLRTMKTVKPHGLEREHNHVHYVWTVEGEPEARVMSGLRGAAQRMHTLGWGIDMAYADADVIGDDAVEALAGTRWIPADRGGSSLAVPVPGTLDDLEATYERFTRRASGKGVDPNTRPSTYRFQAYRRGESLERPHADFSLRLGEEAGRPPEWHETMIVSAWMRHAAGNAMEEEGEDPAWIHSYVMGHVEKGAEGQRLSYVPLPSIGHAHADGRVRRVMILEPAGADGRTAGLLRVKLEGAQLHEAGVYLEPSEDRDTVWPFYLGRSSGAEQWHTVTPVILHGHNTEKGQLSLRKTERLLVQAVRAAGYPDELIAEMSFQPAPYWGGTEGAARIRVPKHLDGWPRYHVALRFSKRVKGPVVVGIGRHYGIGLFAAGRG